MIRVKLLSGAAKRKIRAMHDKLRPSGRRRVMRRVGIKLRDAVRNRFTTQGDGSWAPPSDWIALKTGRRKALLPLRSRIQYKLEGDDTAQVFFDAPTDEWNIQMHNDGFTSPAVEGKNMAFPTRAGKIIRFTKRAASVIPARRIWLTPAETRRIVNEELESFARELENA